ncbi:MAG: HAD-IB family phosphatase [Gammaproteobacteria bacterium]|nr:HAD-IB family phosphatase [Gammaproteobacteria bacterium]
MMIQLQPEHAIDAMVFDCDGTLTRLEGIDELARMNGVSAEVASLTEAAMSDGKFNEAIYQQRLLLTKPTAAQVDQLGQSYFDDRVPDLEAVLALMQRLGKEVYIVSAGLKQAVDIFADKLNIKRENIFAVAAEFDESGHYHDFDHQSPLIEIQGKYEVVKQIQAQHPHILHVGDGMNDYSTFDLVTRFIGYGGVFYRQRMAELCDFYIGTDSMATILPLALRCEELELLNKEEWLLYSTGVSQYLRSAESGRFIR